jgi:hypothetical protein
MAKYLIKKTYTAIKSNNIFKEGYQDTWYCGKNNSYKELCDYVIEDGYSRKHFAIKYIEKDKEFHDRFQSDFWNVNYEIVEVNA